MATFTEIKKIFFQMDKKEQEQLLKELYGLNKETKRFFNIRFGGNEETAFIDEVIKATQSSTPSGYPRNIDVRKVNAIFANAKKCKVNSLIMEQMELRAFEGYITSLNDFGGGPESYENKMYDHLDAYLQLVMQNHPEDQRILHFRAMKHYLGQNTNMICDYLWDLFEEITKIKMA